MTAQRFIEEVEHYYGNYARSATRKQVFDYVSKTFSDRFRDRLFKRLLLDFSGQFKVTPDIAIFEEVKRKLLQEPDYHAPALPPPSNKPSDEECEEIAKQAGELLDELAEKKRLRKSAHVGEDE